MNDFRKYDHLQRMNLAELRSHLKEVQDYRPLPKPDSPDDWERTKHIGHVLSMIGELESSKDEAPEIEWATKPEVPGGEDFLWKAFNAAFFTILIILIATAPELF